MDKSEYDKEVSKLLTNGEYFNEMEGKMFSLITTYMQQYKVSYTQALNELDILIMDSMFSQMRETYLRKEKLKRIIN